MNLEFITETVKDIVREVLITDREISLQARLTSDLGADSFDLVMLSNAVEDEFAILIDDDFILGSDLAVKDVVDKVVSLVNYMA